MIWISKKIIKGNLTVFIPIKKEIGSIRADAAGGVGGLLDHTPNIANKAVKTAGTPVVII